nr:MAG: hypothetical protein 2 [Aparavirus sp.]
MPIKVWLLNNLLADNITNTNIETPESFNSAINSTEPLAHTIFDDSIATTSQDLPLSTTSHAVQNLMDESATINEVLARPFLIEDIHLNVPGTALSNTLAIPLSQQYFVNTVSLPSSILSDPNKISKLEYFRYFTADMKIRIETNAQPYMSGKFWIFYNPYPDLVYRSKDISTLRMSSITSYPGVEYDLNQMSNAEISIPFISYERAFDLEMPQDYCKLYITQLTPIRDTTTETNLRMRIYGWFENVKVFGATSHSNLTRSYLQNKIAEYNQRLNVNFQINTRAEQKGGIVSSISSSIATAGKALSSVPIIGSVASSVGWAADIVSNVASVFGFSRPTSTEPVTKISNVPAHGYTYSSNVDQSVVLASIPDNELGPQTKIFQTDVDEMDFDYIAKNPGVVSVFNYSNTSDNTSWLMHIPCSMYPFNSLATNIGDVASRVTAPTCSEYLASAFRYWRGTICFKISLAKTPFHNGRLILSFDPSNSISDTPYSRIGKAYTSILDLSENSSIVIKIPFLSKFDYLNTYSHSQSLDTISFGTFSIGALAPLLGPATVSSAVDVVVWKWAEDVEFSIPYTNFNACLGLNQSNPSITITIPSTGLYGWWSGPAPTNITASDFSSGNDETIVVLGAGDDSVVICGSDPPAVVAVSTTHRLYVQDVTYQVRQADGSWSAATSATLDLSTVPGPYYSVRIVSNFSANFQINLMNRDEENIIYFNNSNIDNGLLHSLDCIGERIKSVRTLLRMHRLPFTKQSAGPYANYPFGDFLIDTNISYLYRNFNYVLYFSRIFRFYRGGFSLKYIPASNSNTVTLSKLQMHTDGAHEDFSTLSTHSHLTRDDLTAHEIRIPFYSQTYRRVICDHSDNPHLDYSIPLAHVDLGADSYRAVAGDDQLSFGWLVGPPVIVSYATG